MKKNASCSNLKSPSCYRGRTRDRELRECFCGTARQAIGDLSPGCEIFGFTKGQFSLIDIITACLSQTGPAHVDISTWTAANADIRHAQQFVESGKILSTRWVVDRSFPSRQPEYFADLVRRFGADSIRITKTHAKFCTISNENWSIVIRTSMNLNRNPRFENFEISDDPDFQAYFKMIVDEIFSSPDVGELPTNREVDQTFESFEVLGESYTPNKFDLEPLDL
jgi:hypothetical protein